METQSPEMRLESNWTMLLTDGATAAIVLIKVSLSLRGNHIKQTICLTGYYLIQTDLCAKYKMNELILWNGVQAQIPHGHR